MSEADGTRSAPPIPGDELRQRLGILLGAELHAGHQSRVFRADRSGVPIVVKLTDEGYMDSSHSARLEMIGQLASITPLAVGPLRLGDDITTNVDGWAVAAFPFIEGSTPDVANMDDVRQMAAALVGLHAALTEIDAEGLDPVAALVAVGARLGGDARLLHGDYSDANVLLTDEGVRVVDFDDCGTGSVEFEIGNTIYMVMFDGWVRGDKDLAQRFRETFVDEYRRSSDGPVTDAAIDAAIGQRVGALERWLERPSLAPIGIRTSSPEWLAKLRAFVVSAKRTG